MAASTIAVSFFAHRGAIFVYLCIGQSFLLLDRQVVAGYYAPTTFKSRVCPLQMWLFHLMIDYYLPWLQIGRNAVRRCAPLLL